MKIFKTLRSLIGRLEQKEIKLFIGYAQYKKRKKLLLLFDALLKHTDSDEVLVINYLKRKKLYTNFRHSCNELYQLIIRFWNDQSQIDNKLQEVLNLMNAAEIMIKKGLYTEGIAQLENAQKNALEGNSFSLAFECNMKIAHYSGFYAPGNTIKVLGQYQKDQKELLSAISDRSRSYYLSQITYHFLLEGVWSLSAKQRKMMEDALIETEELLKQPNLKIRSKLVLTSVMGNVLQYSERYNKEKCEYYLSTLVDLWESEKSSGALNITRNLLVAYYNLAQFYNLVGDVEQFLLVHDKFKTKFNSLSRLDQTLECSHYYHNMNLWKCFVLKDYSTAIQQVIPKSLGYYEQYSDDIPFSYLFVVHLDCFQIYFATGDYEKAEQFEKQFHDNKLRPHSTLDNRFISKICHIILHFELGDYDYTFNQIVSSKRLYSSYLKNNPAAELLMSLLQKLSSKHYSNEDQIKIYQSYQIKLEETFKVFLNRRIFLFSIFEDWLFAKANGYSTIVEATNATKEASK